MVDIDLEVLAQQLSTMGINGEKAYAAFAKAKEAAEALGSVSLSKLTDSLKTYVTRLENINITSEQLRNGNMKNMESFNAVGSALSKLTAVATKFDAFKDLSVSSSYATTNIATQFNDLIGRFGGFTKAAQALSSSGMGALVNMGEKAASKLIELAGAGQNLENTYIALQSATGKANLVFNANNEILASLSNESARYASNIIATSKMTGESEKTVAAYTAELGLIPGIVGQLVNVYDKYGKQLEGTTAVMTVAKGLSRSLKEAQDNQALAQDNLSQSQGRVTDSAEKGLHMFSLMSEALKIGGLKIQDTKGFLDTVATDFKLVGDNTQSATDLLVRFSGALQNTGLTGKASVEVVTRMVTAVKDLDMGTKALISQRTGGPGGLQGAFKVENLLRDGKVGEVAKMLEQTLKQQFGGRIYTQKEAEQSPQAAAQFYRQRELVKSGAFGGLAKDDASATRLLEAMKSGPAETTSVIKNATEATKDAAEKGQSLQQGQNNLLQQMNATMDQGITLQTLIALNTSKEIIGNKNPIVAKAYENMYQAALSDREQQIKGKQAWGVGLQAEKQTQLAGADTMDILGAVPRVLSAGASKFTSSIVDIFKPIIADEKNNKNKKRLEKEINQDVSSGERSIQRNTMKGVTNEVMNQRPSTLRPDAVNAHRMVESNKTSQTINTHATVTVKVEAADNLNVTTTSDNEDVVSIHNDAIGSGLTNRLNK